MKDMKKALKKLADLREKAALDGGRERIKKPKRRDTSPVKKESPFSSIPPRSSNGIPLPPLAGRVRPKSSL